ncbi:response regulator transcription factor [Lentzea tibetensis]|uniref:Response regulator transcription factor n=1 Tax=Lentzea tibetensis TaxID=2591470 RepID=A0A563EXX2_9PSEU|nr:response regulator transcription factor [Lentzea tibetensis]TWP52570.1 response regulator transcription factor [Lentzea tibetensis]
MNLLRVLLVDDHQMLTEALSAKLSTAPDLWVVGCRTTDDQHLADTVHRLRPNVITIEIEQYGLAIADVVGALKEASPTTRMVVLTASHDHLQAVEAARAGADGWVHKSSSTEHLVDVLRGVCRGQASFPPEHLGAVLRELREDVRRVRDGGGPLDALSAREREVLQAMVDGLRGDEIAGQLKVSANTVRTHTHSIFTKLDVHSRLEAVSVARAAGVRPHAHADGVAPLTPRRDPVTGTGA